MQAAADSDPTAWRRKRAVIVIGHWPGRIIRSHSKSIAPTDVIFAVFDFSDILWEDTPLHTACSSIASQQAA